MMMKNVLVALGAYLGKILLAVLVMTFCSEVEGQIITDRPDQTESSSTVGLGVLQIESGVQVSYEGPIGTLGSSIRSLIAPTSLFRYGITKGVELRLVSQFEDVKTGRFNTSGISDLEIGTKIQLLQKEGTDIEIAFLSHLIVPSGTKAISGNGYGTVNKLSISHSLTEKVGIGYNMGYDYTNGSNIGDFTYSVAIGTSVNNKVGIYIEPYGAWEEFETGVLNLDAGVTYLLNDNFQFDFSFGTGISHEMNYIALGFSWRALSSKE